MEHEVHIQTVRLQCHQRASAIILQQWGPAPHKFCIEVQVLSFDNQDTAHLISRPTHNSPMIACHTMERYNCWSVLAVLLEGQRHNEMLPHHVQKINSHLWGILHKLRLSGLRKHNQHVHLGTVHGYRRKHHGVEDGLVLKVGINPAFRYKL